MRHLVKDALESRSLIRCRRVNGGDVVTGRIRKWIESGSIRDDGPFLTRLGLKEFGPNAVAGGTVMPRNRVSIVPAGMRMVCGSAPDGDPGALGHFLLEGISGVCESMG
jgi:hypothetical protein